MKLWHVVLAAAVAAGVFGFIELGHKAKKTAEPILSAPITIPERASLAVAEQNLQQAVQALQQYRTEHGSYAGASTATLLQLNPGLAGVVVRTATDTTFCVQETVRDTTASITQQGTPVDAPCA